MAIIGAVLCLLTLASAYHAYLQWVQSREFERRLEEEREETRRRMRRRESFSDWPFPPKSGE